MDSALWHQDRRRARLFPHVYGVIQRLDGEPGGVEQEHPGHRCAGAGTGNQVPFTLVSFYSDNGSELLTWALYEYLTGRRVKVPFTRSRAYLMNDNAHCEQKNHTTVGHLFGHNRIGGVDEQFVRPGVVPAPEPFPPDDESPEPQQTGEQNGARLWPGANPV